LVEIWSALAHSIPVIMAAGTRKETAPLLGALGVGKATASFEQVRHAAYDPIVFARGCCVRRQCDAGIAAMCRWR